MVADQIQERIAILKLRDSCTTLSWVVNLSSSCCRWLKVADRNNKRMIASLKHRAVRQGV